MAVRTPTVAQARTQPPPPADERPVRRWLTELLWAVATALLAVLLACLVIRVWRGELGIPFVNRGETQYNLMLAKSMRDHGSYNVNPSLGAPFGLKLYDYEVGTDQLNLLGIARGVTDIAQRARDKKLTPDEVQGGTFTITNPGGYGTFHGTPVISQPQAAILGTYAVVKRPWVIQDDRGEDVIAIRPIMNLTLTYDHRLVDGALAGRFLRDLREKLQTWDESAY